MEYRTDQSSLLEYTGILWARRWLVVSVTGFLVVVALLYSVASTKTYQANAKLLLSPPLPTALLEANNPAAYPASVDVPTDIQIIESGKVASMVAKAIGSAPSVTATEVSTSDVVTVSAESSDPKIAQRAADAYANAYLELQRQQTATSIGAASAAIQQRLTAVESAVGSVSQEVASSATNQPGVQAELSAVQSALQVEESTLQNQLAAYQELTTNQSVEAGQLITPAAVPTKAAEPKTAEYTILALILGMVLGVGLALILQAFADASPPGRRGGGASGNGLDPFGGDGHHADDLRDSGRPTQPTPVTTASADDRVRVGATSP